MRLRRSRSRLVHAVRVLAVACGVVASSAGAQDAPAPEGALFLLLPVGARAVGRGQAVVATRMGADGIWWNPASLGWATRREVTAHYSKNVVFTGNAIDFVQPAGRAGVVGASLLHINFGQQSATDEFGNTIGTIYTRALALTAAYAATFGDRVSAGVAYRYVNQAESCSGSCAGLVTFSASANMFDLGIHALVDKSRALTVGAAVRNAGFCAQIIDAEQCDPPPTRVHAGAEYDVQRMAKLLPGATLRITGELVSRLDLDLTNAERHLGAEFGFAETLMLRGGIHGGTLDKSYASVGFGVRRGTLGFDFARTFGGLSADAGEPPTFVTFRMAFK